MPATGVRSARLASREQNGAGVIRPAPGETPTALVLGGGLRPIVFGAAPPAVDAAAASAPSAAPDLTLSVHAESGRFLGYVVVDRAVPGRTWGGLTVCDDLSLAEACLLARATTRQLAVFDLSPGSHHCVVSVGRDSSGDERATTREQYLAALEPLVEAGLCRIVF